MRVERFEVDGLHGFIEAAIDFFADLTVIVGRNGSGKTSVLDLMSHLIRLDTEALAKTRFSFAQLFLSDESLGRVCISASNARDSRKLTISFGDSAAVSIPLELASDLHDFDDAVGPEAWSWLQLQARSVKAGALERLAGMLSPDGWRESAHKIRKHARLTFVRLDRTILAIDAAGNSSIDTGLRQPPRPSTRSGSPRDPIDDVSQVMRRKHLQFRQRAAQIQRTASSDLIRLHFLTPSAMLNPKPPTEKQLRSKLHELESRVKKSHLIANAPESARAITEFFQQFAALLDEAFPKNSGPKAKVGRRTLKEETLEVMIGVKEKQISELLRIFEKEQEDTAEAYRPIKKYLDIAARFFDDSGKALIFSPDTMDLSFRFSHFRATLTQAANLVDRNEDGPEEKFDPEAGRPIKELSSGERQVLIVLTYLAFLAGEKSIFVIDEPELSLHVKWQEQLIEALTELRPSGCQIILATHAPEIAGRARRNCIVLRPQYLPQEEL